MILYLVLALPQLAAHWFDSIDSGCVFFMSMFISANEWKHMFVDGTCVTSPHSFHGKQRTGARSCPRQAYSYSSNSLSNFMHSQVDTGKNKHYQMHAHHNG